MCHFKVLVIRCLLDCGPHGPIAVISSILPFGKLLGFYSFFLPFGLLFSLNSLLDNLSVEVGNFNLAVEDNPRAQLIEENEALLHLRHLAGMNAF